MKTNSDTVNDIKIPLGMSLEQYKSWQGSPSWRIWIIRRRAYEPK
jgi:hypothetical protein